MTARWVGVLITSPYETEADLQALLTDLHRALAGRQDTVRVTVHLDAAADALIRIQGPAGRG